MSRIVPVTARAGADVDGRWAPQLARHATVQDIWDWANAQSPPLALGDVVVQDEFTHDLIVELEPGAVAVYDVT